MENLYKLQTLDFAKPPAAPSQIAALRAGIPPGMLTTYDRARARGRKGIAIVRNHVCTNCRMQVPVAVTVSLAAGMLQVCGNCGLYLCLPAEEQPATASLPAVAEPKRRKRKPPVQLSSRAP